MYRFNRLIFAFLLIFYFQANADFNGTWKSKCTKLIRRHSITSVIQFSKQNFLSIQKLYSDNECKHLNLELYYYAKFKFTESNFNWEPIQVVIKLANQQVVSYYNKNKICSIENWKLNKEFQVAGKFCKPIYMPEKLISYKDIIIENRPDKIQFRSFPSIKKQQLLKDGLIYYK